MVSLLTLFLNQGSTVLEFNLYANGYSHKFKDVICEKSNCLLTMWADIKIVRNSWNRKQNTAIVTCFVSWAGVSLLSCENFVDGPQQEGQNRFGAADKLLLKYS